MNFTKNYQHFVCSAERRSRTFLFAGVYILALGLVFILLTPLFSLAEVNVSVSIDPKVGTPSDIFSLSVVVAGDDAEKLGKPVFESDGRFSIHSTGVSTSRTIINFKSSTRVQFSFQVDVDPGIEPGTYLLPEGWFEVNGKKVLLESPKVKILSNKEAQKQGSPIYFAHDVSDKTPFVGQQILYDARMAAAQRFAKAAVEDISFEGFWREQLAKQELPNRQRGGVRVSEYRFPEALFPAKVGELEIPARTLEAVVISENNNLRSRQDRAWADLIGIGREQLQRKKVTAPKIELDVRPLPVSPAGVSGYIPVGDLTISSGLSKDSVAVGESFTLTIALRGNANLKPFTLPDPIDIGDDSFKVYVDKPEVSVTAEENGVIFEKTFNVAIVPTREGTFSIPQYRITYFDPKSEQYITRNSPPRKVTVTPGDETESLRVAAAQSTTQDLGTKPEQDITLLRTDIFPQREAARLVQPALKVPTGITWLIIILAPLVSLYIKFFGKGGLGRVRALLSSRQSPVELWIQSIESTLQNEKDTKKQAADISSALRKSLSAILAKNAEALTPDEIENRLNSLHASDSEKDAVRTISKILSELEQLQYSKVVADSSRISKLAVNAKSALTNISSLCKRNAR